MPTRLKQIPPLTLYEATLQIRQAMREGNIAEAINLFRQTGEKKSAALFESLVEAGQAYENKQISLEEWGRVQEAICRNILSSRLMSETKMSETPSPEAKAKILQLLHKRKTEQALMLCESFGDQYLLLQVQLYAAQKQSVKGLIESEYFEATKSKVNNSIEAFMGQITEPSRPERWRDRFCSLFK